ncbi:hypothetical protein DSO57_1003814 [Entomophthora muscae]|uniref:Uncharacterized protein n=1 Tax=Entomophthora muscae TaxID=34485 RepID=A0ACC2UI20_9FUNG|nr:hypothetical protein DSO57_1003814 [Entomophthora muscae]
MDSSQMFWEASSLGLTMNGVSKVEPWGGHVGGPPTARSTCVPFSVAIENFNEADISAVTVDPHLPIKARHRLQAHQTEVLTKHFSQSPNPSPATRAELAELLNMREREVQVWFQNRRAKIKREQAAPSTKKPKKVQRRQKPKTPPSASEPAFCSDPTGMSMDLATQADLLSMNFPPAPFSWEWPFSGTTYAIPHNNLQATAQPPTHDNQMSPFYLNYPMLANITAPLQFDFAWDMVNSSADMQHYTTETSFEAFNPSVPF